MHEIKHTPPNKMTPEQRRLEVASLLANGLARLREKDMASSGIVTPESDFELGFSLQQSVHTDHVNTLETESL